MKTTLPPPFAVYRCAGGLFDEAFVSEHYDPAEAIRACDEGMMFVTVADGNAQKQLDAEKSHQMKLVADQAKVTKKRLRAETDKTRKNELRANLAKSIRRIDCLRKLTVRVDTADAEQAAVVAAAGVDTTDAEQVPVAAAPGVDSTDAAQALVVAAADRVANPLYKELVRQRLRMGQPLSVESKGNGEEISQYGAGWPGRVGVVPRKGETQQRPPATGFRPGGRHIPAFHQDPVSR